MNKKICALSLIVILMIILLSCSTSQTKDSSNAEYSKHINQTDRGVKKITVYISGDIYFPGKYEFYLGQTFFDLWNVAHPYKSILRTNYNLSELLVDNRHYIISEYESGQKSPILINVNLASTTDLVILPNIGKKTADYIIEYRKNNGYFTSIDQFISILKGLSDSEVSDIKDRITI